MNTQTIINAFKEKIQQVGMSPPEDIKSGGCMNRFSDNGNSNKNGWCVLNINQDGTAGAAFGNWKDIKEKWFYVPEGQQISTDQQKYLNKQIHEAQEKAKQNPNSLRLALNAKCYDCCCEQRIEVKYCPVVSCSLYHLRPWQAEQNK